MGIHRREINDISVTLFLGRVVRKSQLFTTTLSRDDFGRRDSFSTIRLLLISFNLVSELRPSINIGILANMSSVRTGSLSEKSNANS